MTLVDGVGSVTDVNSAKYQAMTTAFLKTLPSTRPDATQKELGERVKAHLPADLSPGGKTSGWWAKTVQLDLEAKGLVIREQTRPLRWCLQMTPASSLR